MLEMVENRAVYGILRSFLYDSPGGDHHHAERPSMVLKLVHSWNAAAGTAPLAAREGLLAPAQIDLDDEEEALVLDYNDPMAILLREHKAEKQKHQEADVVSERRLEQRQASQEAQDEEEELRAWHASEQYRRTIEAFSADLDDARQAASHARDRASAQQQQASEALEKSQHNAVVVNGDRVYFTCDGSRLYGEDDRQITDRATIADAKNQQLTRPTATSYEEFVDRRDTLRRSTEQAQKLGETLDRLDDLDRRVKKGDLSPEDLAQASREKQEAIDSLPPEAREEYERLHAARKDDRTLVYRDADPAFSSAPDLVANFRQAGSTAVGQPSQKETDRQSKPERAPVYKAAPDF